MSIEAVSSQGISKKLYSFICFCRFQVMKAIHKFEPSHASIPQANNSHEVVLVLEKKDSVNDAIIHSSSDPPTTQELLNRVEEYNHPSQRYFRGARGGERLLNVCILNRDNPLGKRANVRESQIEIIK